MANKYKVLVVEDEQNIRNLISALLDAGGYSPIEAGTKKEAEMMFLSHKPDVVILDLGLPDGDGMDVLDKIRKEHTTPVIVLSARSDEADKVLALDGGANDYVTKPFGSQELMARVRSVLRNIHSGTNSDIKDGIFENDGLLIDYGARQVSIDGEAIKLTQTEYNIVALLSEHLGKVLTYSFIIKEIWGYSDYGSIKKLQVNMANVRKKMGAKPGKENYIINELGVGYRMRGTK